MRGTLGSGGGFALDWSDPDAPPPPQTRLTCTCGHSEAGPDLFIDYRRLIHEALCHDGTITVEPTVWRAETTLGQPYDPSLGDWRRSR